jgi:hypothetical protein
VNDTDKANEFLYNHNQYPEKVKNLTQLPQDIMQVLKCDMNEAIKLGKTHCNLLSFYAPLLAYGNTIMFYPDFFYWNMKKGFVNKFGFFDVEKSDILKEIANDFEIIEYIPSSKPDRDVSAQMRIENKHGSHFMYCYYKSGTWFFTDTNYRGTGVTLDSLDKDDKVMWIREYRRKSA